MALPLTLLAALVVSVLFRGCDGGGKKNSGATPIGPDGGSVQGDGATVTVPPGALAGDVVITVGQVSLGDLVAPLPDATTLSGQPFAFQPHGTTFSLPVSIVLPYTGSANVILRLDDETDTTWETVSGATFNAGLATFQTSAFSLYAAALEECGPPTPRGTGSTNLTGAGFTPVDVVARVVHMTDVATEGGFNPFRTRLLIRVTDYPNACALEGEEIFRKGGQMVEFSVMRNSDSAFPGLPAPNTYNYDSTLPMANDGTTYFRGGGTLFDCNDNCEWCGTLGSNTPAGSITLTSVTNGTVSGSVNFTDEVGLTYTGSFTSPICGSTSSSPSYCCWTP